MTIKEFFKKNNSIEIELLMAYILKRPKEFLYLNQNYRLTKEQYNNLAKLIKRRQKGEPIAYIIGHKDFYGLRFKVDRNVLVPRPETERIIDCVIARSQATKQSDNGLPRSSDALRVRNDITKILDVGTGSGCIIITLAKFLSLSPASSRPGKGKNQHEFYAGDISPAALKVAKENAKSHRTKVKFICSDLLENIKFVPDILVANLPYLASCWISKKLKYEPRSALLAKSGGLDLINKLLKQIAAKKSRPKLIFLEFDPRQKSKLIQQIKKHLPGAEVQLHRDFAGRWRLAEIIPH